MPGASPRPDEHYVQTGAYPAGLFVPRTIFRQDHVVGSHTGYPLIFSFTDQFARKKALNQPHSP